jgi:hypothetical protein
MEVYTGTGGSAISVQWYHISSLPFAIPLQNGQQYEFQIYSPSQVLLYTQPLSAYPLTITMYIPCSQIGISNPGPVINATCSVNFNTNVLTCQGIDTQNYVRSWDMAITYHASIVSTGTLIRQDCNTNPTLCGASFVFIYQLPNHTIPYYATLNASVGRTANPWYSVFDNLQLFGANSALSPGLAYNAIFGILLFLVFIGVAYINEIAAVIGWPLVVIIGQTMHIFQFAYAYVYGSVGIMIIVAVLMAIFRD